MPNAFPDIHVTGAVHHWIRLRSGGGVQYLGTAENTPQMQLRDHFVPSFYPTGGTSVPYQAQYDGQDATVSVLLSRFSKFTLKAAMQKGGSDARWSRGSWVYGLRDFELWQVFDFADTENASSGLEAGWYWPQVTLPDHQIVTAGTQGEKLLLSFDCTPIFIASDLSPEKYRTWMLYSTEDAYFPKSLETPQ